MLYRFTVILTHAAQPDFTTHYHSNRDIIELSCLFVQPAAREGGGGQCFWMAHATVLPSACPATELASDSQYAGLTEPLNFNCVSKT